MVGITLTKMHLAYLVLQHFPAMNMMIFAVSLLPRPATRLEITVTISCTFWEETMMLLRNSEEISIDRSNSEPFEIDDI